MDLGDIVVIEKKDHPYRGKEAKIVGRRGNRVPGDPWFLVYVLQRGRSYLVPESMLRLVNQRTDKDEILVWPVTGKLMRKKDIKSDVQ